MTGIVPGVYDFSELTDCQVMALYEALLGQTAENLGVHVAEIVKKHIHKPKSNDSERSVQEYVFAIMTDLGAIDVAEIMTDKAKDK